MSKYVGTSFPDGANEGDDFYHTSQHLLYRFLGGGVPSSPLNWIICDGQVASDPDTTGWGNNQRGAKWFNYTEMQWKGWNGSDLVLIG